MTQDGDDAGRTTRSCPFPRRRLDPDPQYEELRRTEPVCRVQMPYGPPAWLVTDYQLARLVFGDPRFSWRPFRTHQRVSVFFMGNHRLSKIVKSPKWPPQGADRARSTRA